MKKETYLKALFNYKDWFKYASNQKEIGDSILNKCILDKEFLLSMKENNNYENFINFWSNTHYHYGIGIENGFKGLIIKYYPEKVNYKESGDSVKLIGIGSKSSMNHNLLQLSEECILSDLMKLSNKDILKRVLQHFSDMIRWGSRYPIPMRPDKIYKFDQKVPGFTVNGFHILDIIDPIFELFEKESD